MRPVNWSLSTGVFGDLLIIAIRKARLRQVRQRREIVQQIDGARIETVRLESDCSANGVEVTVKPEPVAFGVRTRVSGSCSGVGTAEKSPARIAGVIVVKKLVASRPRLESLIVRHEEQRVLAVEHFRNPHRPGQREAVLILAVRRLSTARSASGSRDP